jgi:CheY-like chemotaxis protein
MQGSGLGLWISKGIAGLHKGTLTAFSAGEGSGSTFFLEVPIGNMTTPALGKGDCDGRRKSGTGIEFMPLPITERGVVAKKINTILCVDDSVTSRKIMMRILTRIGYTCFEACDGENCLKVYDNLVKDSVTIDAVLMDYEMPRMNGPTATIELKKRGVTCPIFGITGNVMAADRNLFFASGAFGVLAKPLSLELLEASFSDYYDCCAEHSGMVSSMEIDNSDILTTRL